MTSQLVPFQCLSTAMLFGSLRSRMPASTSSPVAEIVEFPTVAWLVMLTELTATPAPTLTLALALSSPLPWAETLVLAALVTVTVPVIDVMVRPSAKYAVLMVVTMLIATAAATDNDAPLLLSWPSAVPSFGVEVFPEFLPSLLFAAWVSLAFLRLLSASLLVSLPSDLDPEAAASASVEISEEPDAWKLMGPEACRLRKECASTVWLTTAKARDKPMPAFDPTVVSPLALVVTDPVKVAVTWILPLLLIWGPAPSEATDDSFAIDTAIDGVIATLPLERPSVSFVSESVLLEPSVMSVAPVTGGPLAGFETLSNPVKTSLLTRFRPIEAPT